MASFLMASFPGPGTMMVLRYEGHGRGWTASLAAWLPSWKCGGSRQLALGQDVDTMFESFDFKQPATCRELASAIFYRLSCCMMWCSRGLCGLQSR